MFFLLIWILLGSFGANFLWIKEHKKILNDFDLWKEAKNKKITTFDYIKAMLFSMVCGPFTFLFLLKK